jgi:hypothetical protein
MKKVYKAVDRENGRSVVWNESEMVAVSGAMKILKREFAILKALGGMSFSVHSFSSHSQMETNLWMCLIGGCNLNHRALCGFLKW